MSKISQILSSHSKMQKIQLPAVKQETLADIQCLPSDQTPNRFLASCMSLIETNPFEQSFSVPESLPPINTSMLSLHSTVSAQPSSATFSTGSVSSNDSKMTDKKKSTLESNRRAASKCRQKKKEKIERMQRETVQFEQENNMLQGTVGELEQEIKELKAILLSHRECPVAQGNGFNQSLIESK